MIFSLFTGITGVLPSLYNIYTMDSKRGGSKDPIESETGDAVKQVSMGFPIYEDTNLFIEKEIKMKWKDK